MKRWSMMAACSVFLAGMAGCRTLDGEGRNVVDTGSVSGPVAVFETSAGRIDVELNQMKAPISVGNFIRHAQSGHYDGTIFHRVVPGFVVQGGGWTPDLAERAKISAAAGQPDIAIVNEWKNGLSNRRGTIGMAREEAPDTATREFYFNLSDNLKLDTARPNTGNAGYAVFGRVVSGMNVIDHIATLPNAPREVPGVTDGSMNNVPVDPVIVERIWIRRR